MQIALEYAKKAAKLGEVPVGAIVVLHDEIVGFGYNKRETGKNVLGHAEIIAVNMACKNLEKWRLSDCTLYVTLEPCSMCAGAAINARIKRIVYGAFDEKSGACGSLINLTALPLNHTVAITYGVLEDECKKLLTEFFQSFR